MRTSGCVSGARIVLNNPPHKYNQNCQVCAKPYKSLRECNVKVVVVNTIKNELFVKADSLVKIYLYERIKARVRSVSEPGAL